MKPTLLLALMLAGLSLAHADEQPDMHFRPFGIEPADRTEWGHGHLVGGIDHELHPAPGTHHRTVTPLEATVGLPAGFSLVLGLEGSARTVFDDHSRSSNTGREALLKYSLPTPEGIHVALLAGVNQRSGQPHQHSQGYAVTLDTPIGDLGFGQTWDRRPPGEPHGGRESGINLFRLGLGADGRWGVGGELRHARLPSDASLDHWLLGVARIVGHGLLADVAIGGTRSADHQLQSRRVTAGLSWFF
jgi:hypothetical protein